MSKRYATAVRFVRGLVAVFFRRVEVAGLENVPTNGGGLFVAWHPNGLIDPGLILAHAPKPVVFGARHGLFRVPILGWLLRGLGCVPIYRAMDNAANSPEAAQAANRRSLEALAAAVVRGGFAALFPEGDSHDEPRPIALRTGVARLYEQACAQAEAGADPPVVVPVGLHYDHKRSFRSHALLVFHPPLAFPATAVPADGETGEEADRARWRAFTDEIDHALQRVVHATDDWETHHLLERARRAERAERLARSGAKAPEPADLAERTLGFGRLWAGYEARRRTHGEQVQRLLNRLRRYEADLRALALTDDDLDRDPSLGSRWLPAILILQFVTVFLLMPPFLVLGYLVNVPVAYLVKLIAKLGRQREKDEATIKVLAGFVLFPLAWGLVAWAAASAHDALAAEHPALPASPLGTGLIFAGLTALGGIIALRYLRLARETARAIATRLTRHRRRYAVMRLRGERAEIVDALYDLGRGLTLPTALAGGESERFDG